MKIESVYCFDYTNNFGYYESIRDFRSEEMTYISFAFSTLKVHVNATPDEFKIGVNPSNKVREFVVSHLDELKEISEMLAENSPKYILLCFEDESKMYYEYNESFCEIFSLIKQYRPNNERDNNEDVNLYSPQKEQNPYAYIHSVSNITTQKSLPKTYNDINIQKKSKEESFPWIRFILLIILFIIAVVGIASAFSQPDPNANLIPVNEPISGTILSGIQVYDGSEITITASGGTSCVVKLKDSSGIDVMSFYVRAGDTITVGVPAESLFVYFATGDEWYGTRNLFGEETDYSMDDKICDFENYTYEYTLYPVSNGNFSETPIDAEDF